ncbi:MAG: AraC family transcriptional regulator [Ktedonobacteraceae bacterium]|nr:AraC family transcriptional regulator [Ktedonobacteraceae bacterium]
MSDIQTDLCETHVIGEYTNEHIVSQQACQAFAFYRLQLAGISIARPPFCFVRKQPRMSQLIVCLDGWGYVLVDGAWERCTPGMAYATPAGHLHAYHASDEVVWKICWVMYDEAAHGQPVIAVDRPTLLPAEPQELAVAIDGLYREYIGLSEQLVMQQWVQLVHIHAQRIVGPVRMERRLQRLWEVVNADITFPWTNRQLAAVIGISSEQLRRLCQQYLGRSPMKHVTMLRMRRAMMLLASDYYTVEAVAQRTGYENSFAFSTAFKRHTGISPSQYRNRSQG